MAEKSFELSKPIITHEGETKALSFREPTLGDMFDLPLPFTADGRIDFAALKKWLTRLSGKDAGVIGQVLPHDMYPIMEWLGEKLAPADAKN